MSWRVRLRILPRAGLLDPQGQAIEHALSALRFTGVSGVHVGKAISLELEAPSREAAEQRAREMCDRLLANPVTEDYEIQVEPLEGS